MQKNVMWLMKRAFYQQRRAMEDAVRTVGSTTAQAGVLNLLAQEPGLSGAELARVLLISPQAAQVALTSLERRGLVTRRNDPNHGRILRAYLTAAGKRTAKASYNAALEVQNKALATFDARESKLLVEFLERMIEQYPVVADDGY
jgi:DNA-binding MarR family transcriptional regulator